MRSLIVCVSVSHGNTKRIARAMADEIGASVLEPEDVDPTRITDYDLVGFGSGVYFGRVHPRLVAFVRSLPRDNGLRTFVFATSGTRAALPCRPHGWPVQTILRAKGYQVIGAFSCRGWDTVGPLRFIGGVNRGHPTEEDIAAARRFAADLRAGTRPTPLA